MKIKSSQNGENTLSFTDEGKSCQSREFFVANMSVNAICEKKSKDNFQIYSKKKLGATLPCHIQPCVITRCVINRCVIKGLHCTWVELAKLSDL